jgi:hypothetical protein
VCRSQHPGDTTVNSRGDAELVVYVNDVLQTGLVPAKVRAVLYQALAIAGRFRENP